MKLLAAIFRIATLTAASCLAALSAEASSAPSKSPEPPPPSTPVEYFNAGTANMLESAKVREPKAREEKLNQAEFFLKTAVQHEDLQRPALYNLGQVHFVQGQELLKKGPAASSAASRARSAALQGTDALRAADEALTGDQLQALVAAYMEGRGARKELKAATELMVQALQAHGATLDKWGRALQDFKSDVELKDGDGDVEAGEARYNARLVERSIARLGDSQREMQQMCSGMCDKHSQLGQKLKQLKGRIPDFQMPPGGAGDDEEDEDMPFGPKLGDKEGASKPGKEMSLSQDEASRLLDSFKLGGERRMPMGQGEPAKPRDHSGRTW
jgi:hypothetical protein